MQPINWLLGFSFEEIILKHSRVRLAHRPPTVQAFEDVSYRGVCLLSNVMELDGNQLLVFKQSRWIKSTTGKRK